MQVNPDLYVDYPEVRPFNSIEEAADCFDRQINAILVNDRSYLNSHYSGKGAYDDVYIAIAMWQSPKEDGLFRCMNRVGRFKEKTLVGCLCATQITTERDVYVKKQFPIATNIYREYFLATSKVDIPDVGDIICSGDMEDPIFTREQLEEIKRRQLIDLFGRRAYDEYVSQQLYAE